MRKRLFPPMALLAVFVGLVSCNHESPYDPKADAANRNPLQLTTTENFNWENLQKVGLTVRVADEYSGVYTYGVKVFDHNPITHSDATLLAQGTATESLPFYASIEIGKGTTTLYVQQTTPTGVKLVRSAEVSGTSATIDFRETSRAKTSVASRAKSDYSLPDMPDDSNFPSTAPSDAKSVTGNITASGNYILTGSVGTVSASDVNLYVTSDVTLKNKDFITGNNVNIYILPGATLTMDTKYRWILQGTTKRIYISKGGTLSKIGDYPELGLDGNSAIYNRGTMKMRLIECLDNSILYNLDSGVITGGQTAGSFFAFRNNSYFINDGTATIYDFNNVNDDRAGNIFNYGTMNVSNMTYISAINPVWVNEGQWVTKNFNYAERSQPTNVLNKCSLTVANKMEVYSIFTVDAGGSVVTKDLLMTKGGIDLRSGSLFRVDGVATYKYDNGVFTGTGPENALLIMNCATAEGTASVSSSKYPHYVGKLVVACDNYQGDKNVRTAGGALLTSDVNNTGVNIPKTECNPGHIETPDPPTSIDYRYGVSFSGIYAIEDMWPDFGDYDMNDVVVKLSINAFGDGSATSEAEAKNIKLTNATVKATFMATGADNNLGAYVQLDNVSSSIATLSNANGISLESGQSKLVLQLTNSVNTLMGGKYVNVKGTRDEKLYKSVSGDITLSSGISAADINFSKVNFFITVNDSGKGTRKEIHLKNFPMSSKGASSGNEQVDKYYTADNFVWGVCVPSVGYNWPDESVSIKDVNNDFVKWVVTGGTSGTNWYNATWGDQVTQQ